MESKSFSQEEKKSIIKYIETIKSKKILIQIFKIINNDTNKYSKNNNGVFINLKNVSDSALSDISKVIDGKYDCIASPY